MREIAPAVLPHLERHVDRRDDRQAAAQHQQRNRPAEARPE